MRGNRKKTRRTARPLLTLLLVAVAGGCGVRGASTPSTPGSVSTGGGGTPGTCRARGSGPFSLPDSRCTPGAANPDVTQGTIGRTICVSGWSSRQRPPASVTEPEKIASMRRYGDTGSPRGFEYDHLVAISLGGALNDSRNLWPEPGGTPNPKDRLENQLHEMICGDRISLADAQRAIASDWVAAYHRYVK